MNQIQVLETLEKNGIIIDITYWAPEIYMDSVEFVKTIKDYRMFDIDIDKNFALFILCENQEAFKNYINNGNDLDAKFIENNFKKYAQDCYNILSKLKDLEEWQVKLMHEFKKMI